MQPLLTRALVISRNKPGLCGLRGPQLICASQGFTEGLERTLVKNSDQEHFFRHILNLPTTSQAWQQLGSSGRRIKNQEQFLPLLPCL